MFQLEKLEACQLIADQSTCLQFSEPIKILQGVKVWSTSQWIYTKEIDECRGKWVFHSQSLLCGWRKMRYLWWFRILVLVSYAFFMADMVVFIFANKYWRNHMFFNDFFFLCCQGTGARSVFLQTRGQSTLYPNLQMKNLSKIEYLWWKQCYTQNEQVKLRLLHGRSLCYMGNPKYPMVTHEQ